MFDNSSVSLPPVEARVNSSYDAANRNLSEIQQTHQDSEQLLQDVTEAEGKTRTSNVARVVLQMVYGKISAQPHTLIIHTFCDSSMTVMHV